MLTVLHRNHVKVSRSPQNAYKDFLLFQNNKAKGLAIVIWVSELQGVNMAVPG